MRYAAGFTYGLAAAGGATDWLNGACVGALVFCGTVCLVFAIEHTVDHALRRHRQLTRPIPKAIILGD